ncbi:hypothetical protein LTR50_001836 [Elasticomyces elasticus]|nr:hypothetical protein LTR50_001836 [Elasticomyces elasticus]
MGLPQQQQAAVREGSGGSATAPVKQVPVPQEPGPGQILVKINWTGLCASDKSLIHDEWATQGIKMMDQTNGIAGHEGAGEVVAVHKDVENLWKVGDRAGVKWVVSVCRDCEFCNDGTGPELMRTRIPEGVSDEEAGPIMCGGVTAYTACKRSGVRPGQWIVMPGAGGGLGHLGVQYAKAMGMRVIAIDGGPEKEKLCKQLGAEHFLDFEKTKDLPGEVMKITTYGAHGVIVTAASKEGYATAPHFLRPGGTLVVVGLPKDETVIAGAPPIMLALRRLNVVGSVTGTLKDTEEALDFTARGLVHPILTKGTLHDVDKFCKLMGAGKLPGRAVLKVAA